MTNTQIGTDKSPIISTKLLLLMSTAIAASVANLYYSQPILPEMGKDLGINGNDLGLIPAACQLGYAVALLFISPLGDNMPRKKLIAILSIFLIAASLMAVAATSLTLLIIACFIIGLSANITQQLIPFAASLATVEKKGRVIGTLMTGLTIGILLSRTLSGVIGENHGWRGVFIMSATLALLFGLLLQLFLPLNKPDTKMLYPKLIGSMFVLCKQHASLRYSGIAGGLWFAAFNALWVTLALHVSQAPFYYNAQQAGLFGIIALAGVSGAKLSGLFVNRLGPQKIISLGLIVVTLGFIISGLFGQYVSGLIIGVICIDFGIFCAQVANQVRVFTIDPAAQSRINGVYMLFYFIGGAFGSLVGVKVFDQFGWTGVSIFSLLLIAFSFMANNMPLNIHSTSRLTHHQKSK